MCGWSVMKPILLPELKRVNSGQTFKNYVKSVIWGSWLDIGLFRTHNLNYHPNAGVRI